MAGSVVPSWSKVTDAKIRAGAGRSFALDVTKFVEKAKGNTTLVVRRVALDMFTRVIDKSPVDTGRFRANWQTGIGTAPPDASSPPDKSGAEAKARVVDVAGRAVAGDVIALGNSLPYARRLEYGYSMQAPAGMVRTTLREFGAVVDAAAREVNR